MGSVVIHREPIPDNLVVSSDAFISCFDGTNDCIEEEYQWYPSFNFYNQEKCKKHIIVYMMYKGEHVLLYQTETEIVYVFLDDVDINQFTKFITYNYNDFNDLDLLFEAALL